MNRLKHLGVRVPDNQGGDLHEVTIQYQHTPSSLEASSVGLNNSPGSHNQDENLGAEFVNKGEPQKFAKLFFSKPCKCGQQQSHDQSFPHNFPNKEKREKQGAENFVFKKGLNKLPTPPENIGGGDHIFYKEIFF